MGRPSFKEQVQRLDRTEATIPIVTTGVVLVDEHAGLAPVGGASRSPPDPEGLRLQQQQPQVPHRLPTSADADQPPAAAPPGATTMGSISKKNRRILVAVAVVLIVATVVAVAASLALRPRQKEAAAPEEATMIPSTPSETIVPGFPDAIRCSESGHIFYFVATGKYQSLFTTNTAGDSEFNQVSFNPTTGDFLDRAGSNEFSALCLRQSISDIYRLGRAYHFVESSTTTNTTKGVLLPDALLCAEDRLFFVQHQRNDGRYDSAGFGGVVEFNETDGTYLGQINLPPEELCVSRSLRTLYEERRAFRFFRSIVPDPEGMTSMVPNFPDVVQCGEPGAGRSDLFYRSHDHSYIQFLYNHYGPIHTRFVTFNVAGDYLDRGGTYDEGTDGCVNKSVYELYEAGLAFNIVNPNTPGRRPGA
jgi:hypothetical protein